MAKPKTTTTKLYYISVPSNIIQQPLSSTTTTSSSSPPLLSPKKKAPTTTTIATSIKHLLPRTPKTTLLLLLLLAFLGTLKLNLLLPFSPSSLPCTSLPFPSPPPPPFPSPPLHEFWKQPMDQSSAFTYRPCLDPSQGYSKSTPAIVGDRRKYLLVVVSGGLNQQRNQIVDAVVIARILGAALVVPILQVNVIWADESEFSDVFDLDHFKKTLANDVRVVSSLPSTHVMTRPVEKKITPLHVSVDWIRSRYQKRINREGVLLLRGLDSRLSKDLPPDLQKLRCKVAFRALRFAAPIRELGNTLVTRMRSKGPYLALHLRMEKDVWVRTGCLPGLSPQHDRIVQKERKFRPELLTGRSNMSFHERKLAGLCPLTSVEVSRLLKALGVPRDANIFWAGGEPLGGREALLPLMRGFPNLYNKYDISVLEELEPFANKSSLLAAIDYMVVESSDVFMPSHGGNMGRAMQGQRAFSGHRKYITPNKREMLPFFLNSSLPEEEFSRIVKELHGASLGQPERRSDKVGRDVTAYPFPECMCIDERSG